MQERSFIYYLLVGGFSETLPDPDECEDIRPDFGDTHFSLDNPFIDM